MLTTYSINNYFPIKHTATIPGPVCAPIIGESVLLLTVISGYNCLIVSASESPSSLISASIT